WYTFESREHHHCFHSSLSFPAISRKVIVKDIGAHSDSGQTQSVRPSSPSMHGAGTPHSIFPVSLNGTSVFPVLYRIPFSVSTEHARSLLSRSPKTRVADVLPSSSASSNSGSICLMESNWSR